MKLYNMRPEPVNTAFGGIHRGRMRRIQVLALESSGGGTPEVADFLHKCIEGITGTRSHSLTETQCNNIEARSRAARRLCWNLGARRFPKLAFRLRTGVQHSGGATHKTIADEYVKPQARFDLERRVEQACNLPMGAVVIHCPSLEEVVAHAYGEPWEEKAE